MTAAGLEFHWILNRVHLYEMLKFHTEKTGGTEPQTGGKQVKMEQDGEQGV